ncbi:cupredoxin domain-containing protein [Terriglobus albidus]|uniref:cupredoxin domain-containing protein n=1 Tax=Terriglobus albidus TaxID=1592106 RepID=UPI0021E089D4|nr:cupredoxin family copper-binding protein [Terriglobus albidus]
MMTRLVLSRFILSLLLPAGLWSGTFGAKGGGLKSAAGSALPSHITIANFQFQPISLTVHTGDTVIWENRDIVPHTVTDSRGAFDSGSIAPGSSWNLKTTAAGTYQYVCTLHPNMKATLIVK